LGLDVIRHIDLDQNGKHITNTEHAQPFDPVLKSVLDTSEEWLGCKIVRGKETGLSDKATVFTITQQDAVALGESTSDSLPDVMDVLARQDASLLVLAGSVRMMSVKNVFDKYGIKSIHVHLPIGPRKLIRAVRFALDLDRGPRSPEPPLREGFVLSNATIPARGTLETADSFPWFNAIRKVPDTLDSSKVAVRPQPQRWSTNYSKRSEILGITPLTTEAPGGSSAPFPLKSRHSQGAKKIILVEDNEISVKARTQGQPLTLLSQLLVALAEKLKLPYHCAVNGREAFDLYRDSPSGFFLILMDLSMPVMDGYTSTAKIRKLEKELHLPRTTIVALTGVTNEESKQRAFDSGVDEYYTKPIHMKDIKKLVETAQRPPS
jgi:CheY-like chemotaxis protein